MAQILLSQYWWPFHRHQTKDHKYNRATNHKLDDSDLFFEVNDNDAVAIIAYAEAVQNMAINSKLVDFILIQEMKNALDQLQGSKAVHDVQQVATELVPTAKKMLNRFYQESLKHSIDREDVCHCVHEDCEIELLQFLTHIYVRNFIYKYYYQLMVN